MDRPNLADNMKRAEEILSHYGIKGMKWGVRRTPAQLDAASSQDSKKVRASRAKLKSEGSRALSNQELQEVVTRMNLEQQYRNLSSKEPSRLSRGQSTVRQILSVARTAQDVYNVVNSPAGKALRELMRG